MRRTSAPALVTPRCRGGADDAAGPTHRPPRSAAGRGVTGRTEDVPIRGAALVRGKILAPAIVRDLIASLALIGAAIFFTDGPLRTRITHPWIA